MSGISVSHLRRIFNKKIYNMKLHLPKGLRAALLAVIGTAALYVSTSQAAPAAEYGYVSVQQTMIQEDVHANDPPLFAAENFAFVDPATAEPINWNKSDWALSIDAINVASTPDAAGDQLGTSILTNSGAEIDAGNDSITLNTADSFCFYLSAQGRIRIVFSGKKNNSVAKDIMLFRLDGYNWEANPDCGDVSIRLNFSWDADGGLAKFEGGYYGALTFEGAYLLDNESHDVISKINTFYDGEVLLNSYTMPEDFLSVSDPEASPVNGGGLYTLANDGATIKLTAETPGTREAWLISGKTNLNYLLEGKDGEAFYTDTVNNSVRLMGAEDTVYFNGGKGVLWLTEGDYTYNQLTRVKAQITGSEADGNIGFAAMEGCTLTVAKNVLHSTALSTGCGIRALGDGKVVFEVNTDAFDESGLELSTDGFTVFSHEAGARYLRFVEIGENTDVDLKVIGNHVVTVMLGDGSIGSNATITRLRNNPDDNNLNGDLVVDLNGAAKAVKTTYIGKVSNEDGNLILDGVNVITTEGEDDEVITTEVISRLGAKELYARGDIEVAAQVRVSGEVKSELSFKLEKGFLEAGSMVAGGNFYVGSEGNPDVRLSVSGSVETSGTNAIFGTASVGSMTATNSVFVRTDANEKASLGGGSITAPSVQSGGIVVKGEGMQELLKGGFSIGAASLTAGTVCEEVEVTLKDEASMSVAGLEGGNTILLDEKELLTNASFAASGAARSAALLSIDKNALAAVGGKLEVDSIAIDKGYEVAASELVIKNGMASGNGLSTTGVTTLSNVVLKDGETTGSGIVADSITIENGHVVNNVALSAAGGITSEGATLNKAVLNNRLITNGETVLVDATIASTNLEFGGAEGDSFSAGAACAMDKLVISGTITPDGGQTTLTVGNLVVHAEHLSFDTPSTYTVLQANGDSEVDLTGSDIDIYVPAYTYANVQVGEDGSLEVTGRKDEASIKAELADTELRDITMTAIEEISALSPDGVAAALHDAMGDVIHTGFERRQEILDAIAGASTTALADSQRRGIMEVQSNLRNRIVQMGGGSGWENTGIQAWAQADTSFSSSDSGDDGPGYDFNTWGATVGANVDISENVAVGMAFSASYGEIDADSADNASGNNDAYYLNLFARHQTGRWTQMLILTAGMNDMDLERNVGGYSASGNTDGMSLSAYYELGYVLGLNEEFTHIIQPLVNVRITSAKVDGYTEDGSIGDAALEYDGDSYVYGSVGIGLRYQGVMYESVHERNAVLEARALVTQDFGDTTETANVALGGAAYEVSGTDSSGTGFELGAGISVPVEQHTTFYADVDMTIRPDTTGFRANVGMRYDF